MVHDVPVGVADGSMLRTSLGVRVNKTFGAPWGNVIGKTMLSGAQSFTTSVASSAINAVSWDEENGLGRSNDAFDSGVYGGLVSAASAGRNAFERILAGQTNIREDGTGDFKAQTEYEPRSGTHTITLGRDALADGSRFGRNILLAHEAYRNGIDVGEEGQAIETQRAVLGHIQVAAALGSTYGFDTLSGDQYSEVRALQAAYAGNTAGIARIVVCRLDQNNTEFWLTANTGEKYKITRLRSMHATGNNGIGVSLNAGIEDISSGFFQRDDILKQLEGQ